MKKQSTPPPLNATKPSAPPAQPRVCQDVQCPFCHDTGFDKLGLKSHLLNGDCEQFNQLPILTRHIF